MQPKVLMVAPEPFTCERGTPLNVQLMVETLADAGYQVDLLVYPLGKDYSRERVAIKRGIPIPGINSVPVGPSWQKILLDIGLLLRGLGLLPRGRYAAIHGVEEGAFIAGIFALLTRRPFVMDLDSCIPSQLASSGFITWSPLLSFVRRIEKFFLKRASYILTVCTALTKKAKRIAPDVPVVQIEDCPVDSASEIDQQKVAELKKRFAPAGRKSVVYTGNLESYQGLELLLESFSIVARKNGPTTTLSQLVIVGGLKGNDPQREALFEQARTLKIDEYVTFLGPLPLNEMGNAMAAADVLVSPRHEGENTPLKIYSYMAAGRPIVATNLPTHTQVLDSECAFLAEPSPELFASAIKLALSDDAVSQHRACRLAEAAQKRVAEHYSRDCFKRRLTEMYEAVLSRSKSQYGLSGYCAQ